MSEPKAPGARAEAAVRAAWSSSVRIFPHSPGQPRAGGQEGIRARTRAGPRGAGDRTVGDHSSAAAALQQMAVALRYRRRRARRPGARTPGPCAVRRGQDKTLIDALSKRVQPNRVAIETFASISPRPKASSQPWRARLEQSFRTTWRWRARSRSRPRSAPMLGADEALVFWLAGGKESYVFALTRELSSGRQSRSGAGACAEGRGFPPGLEVEAVTRAGDAAGKPELFDLGVAHELYGPDRPGRGSDQGQATSARRSLGRAHRATVPPAGDGEARGRRAQFKTPRTTSPPIAMPPGCSSAMPSPCCPRSRASRRCGRLRIRGRPRSR